MRLARVDILTWPLWLPYGDTAQLYAFLSPDEQTRCQSFRSKDKANEFIISRGVVRQLLALRCGVSPKEIVFAVTKSGKMSLQNPAPAVAFNLSHSGKFCALAIGNVSDLGVDIEVRDQDIGDIVECVFSPEEAARFEMLPRSIQPETFYRAWVLKEAYLKATGQGLAGGLTTLELDLGDGTDVRPRAIGGLTKALADWRFHRFSVNDKIVGAIAAKTGGGAIEVTQRRVNPECVAL